MDGALGFIADQDLPDPEPWLGRRAVRRGTYVGRGEPAKQVGPWFREPASSESRCRSFGLDLGTGVVGDQLHDLRVESLAGQGPGAPSSGWNAVTARVVA